MSKKIKFSGQMDAKVFKELEAFQKQTGQTKTALYTEMAQSFLRSRRIRPEFLKAMEQIILEDQGLLKRLAK